MSQQLVVILALTSLDSLVPVWNTISSKTSLRSSLTLNRGQDKPTDCICCATRSGSTGCGDFSHDIIPWNLSIQAVKM